MKFNQSITDLFWTETNHKLIVQNLTDMDGVDGMQIAFNDLLAPPGSLPRILLAPVLAYSSLWGRGCCCWGMAISLWSETPTKTQT